MEEGARPPIPPAGGDIKESAGADTAVDGNHRVYLRARMFPALPLSMIEN